MNEKRQKLNKHYTITVNNRNPPLNSDMYLEKFGFDNEGFWWKISHRDNTFSEQHVEIFLQEMERSYENYRMDNTIIVTVIDNKGSVMSTQTFNNRSRV